MAPDTKKGEKDDDVFFDYIVKMSSEGNVMEPPDRRRAKRLFYGWTPDQEVNLCLLCNNKFTQIRRKHHCRHCGKVYCSKCCDNKVALPHLGYEEPQRICDNCLHISELLRKARSLQFAKKQESARGLTEMTRSPETLAKMVEYGGVQTLVYLGQSIDDCIKASVAEGIHSLATQTALHPLLIQCGTCKALCSFLSTVDESQEATLTDTLGALILLCKSNEGKTQAVKDGALDPLLSACSRKEHIALLAVTTLSLIADHQRGLAALIESDKDALGRIMTLTNSSDEKMQEMSLKILALLSMGSDWHRHKIVQENYTCGNCISDVVNRAPKNRQVLVNAACLVGNLAACEQDQASLRTSLVAMADLVRSHGDHDDIQLQVSRALANFSRYQIHADVLVRHLELIVQKHLKSANKDTHYHGLRCVVNLVSLAREDALSVLRRSGLEDFVGCLLTAPGMAETIYTALLRLVADKCKPMSL